MDPKRCHKNVILAAVAPRQVAANQLVGAPSDCSAWRQRHQRHQRPSCEAAAPEITRTGLQHCKETLVVNHGPKNKSSPTSSMSGNHHRARFPTFFVVSQIMG